MRRIGLSYRGASGNYDAYAQALLRRAATLDLAIEPVWLAGTQLPSLPPEDLGLSGVLFTGGEDIEPRHYGRADAAHLCECDAVRDASELALMAYVERNPLPVLAICRGAQIWNVQRGGTLIPDLGDRNPVHRRAEGERKSHGVRIEPGSMLAGIAALGEGTANSSHHQAVDRLGAGLRASAWSEDGVMEAYEAQDTRTFFLALQWHPEAMTPGEPLADRVLDAFLQAVAAD